MGFQPPYASQMITARSLKRFDRLDRSFRHRRAEGPYCFVSGCLVPKETSDIQVLLNVPWKRTVRSSLFELRPFHMVNPMPYYTDASRTGRICCHKLDWPIVVTESADIHEPIGEAKGAGKSEDGQTRWSLKVHGADIPGQFIVVDGLFTPVADS